MLCAGGVRDAVRLPGARLPEQCVQHVASLVRQGAQFLQPESLYDSDTVLLIWAVIPSDRPAPYYTLCAISHLVI